jgi:hypothetical protein
MTWIRIALWTLVLAAPAQATRAVEDCRPPCPIPHCCPHC